MSEKTFSDANFQTDVLSSPTPVLVDFWAEWCGPCKMMTPVIDRLAKANEGKVVIGKMNVDDNQGTPQKFGIQGIPTLILFKGGQEFSRLVGFQSQEKIQEIINEAL